MFSVMKEVKPTQGWKLPESLLQDVCTSVVREGISTVNQVVEDENQIQTRLKPLGHSWTVDSSMSPSCGSEPVWMHVP